MSVLDAVADNSKLLDTYREDLKRYKKTSKEYEQLQLKQAELIKAFDYNSFLLNEFVEANLQIGEKEELEEKLESLTHVEDIKTGLSNAVAIMGVISSLVELRSSLSSLRGMSKNIDSFLERIESLIIESNDLSSEIESLAEETEYNPALIDEINDRLQLIYNLEKKHNTSDIQELIDIQKQLQIEVESVENLDAELERLNSEKQKAFEKVNAVADKLHKRRESKISEVCKQVSEILTELGMPNAELGIELLKSDKLLKDGTETIKFKLSANKGGKMDEIGKVASGGELSRVMLAVKTILSEKKNLPTIIFDEIDTGVSGEIADKIGNIMTDMSKRMQVISITHLPQIAGRGTLHYKVFKHDKKGVTQTEMISLNKEERIEELAKMLSGSNITESAKVHAMELLKV